MIKQIAQALLAGCFLMRGCKKNDITPIATADVNNKTDLYPSAPAKWFGGSNPYYLPAGFVGDVMPYYANDSFHLFYLHDARNGAAGFHPWNKFTTKNLTEYNYNGVMIPYGSATDYDLALGTGSIVKVGDTYCAYYSGFNPNFNGSGGKYRDNILMATSKDLNKWQKNPSFLMKPETTNGYNFWEFRDPYIFYNTEKNEYWMLVAGQKDNQAAVMLYTCTDPIKGNWQLKDPLYTTSLYKVPETPQLFKWGSYWYLLFSENSATNTTRYRIAASSSGPWTTPAQDQLDGAYMYASKFVSDGTNQYLFGWCPTKSGFTDMGNRDFGGNLVTHRLTQNADGTLNVSMPLSAENIFSSQLPLTVKLRPQQVSLDGNTVAFPNTTNASYYILFDRIEGKCMITATIADVGAGTETGFVLGMDPQLQNTNFYRLRLSTIDGLIAGEEVTNPKPRVDAQLPFNLAPGKEYKIKLVIDGSVCVLYINDQTALTTRVYSANHNLWGLYAKNGTVKIKELAVKGW